MKKILIMVSLVSAMLAGCTPVVKEYQDLKKRNYRKHFVSGRQPVYSGDSVRNILFPVGGLGTGDLLLGGRGEMRALEIFGQAAIDGELPEMTFFALWLKEGKEFNYVEEVEFEPVVKILEQRLEDNFPGPWGESRNQLAGIPRFDRVKFTGTYPFARLEFHDRDIPVRVELEVFNPFIPLDIDRSSYPAAIYHWKITNDLDKPVEVATLLCMSNPFVGPGNDNPRSAEGAVTEPAAVDAFSGIRFASAGHHKGTEHEGDFAVIGSPGMKIRTHAYRGRWWDDAHQIWDDFSRDGLLEPLEEPTVNPGEKADVASCWIKTELKPGEFIELPFIFTWYVPRRTTEEHMAFGNPRAMNQVIENYYATRFGSALEVADSIIANRDYLYGRTKEYTDILFGSSYPDYVIDALSANTAGLKTNLVMLDGKGRFHGFEGLGNESGCCAGTCTHVWNYAQTMAFLFPELERRVRTLSFTHDTHQNGYQCFRTTFPPGDYWFKAVAADGQMGNILRVYREWTLSGNDEWLAGIWPAVKAALEFAWKGSGKPAKGYEWMSHARIPWDPAREGVMRGRQHNTYDIDFYGPNMMTGSLYLGALKACSEMALAMKEPGTAQNYLDLYEKGRDWYEEELWNGEYFIQNIEVLEGMELPEHLLSPADSLGRIMPKYQFGEGCLSDQLLGQFLAHVSGLGYLIDPEKADKAIHSVYRYNYKKSLRHFENVQRVYALNNEGGTVACTWPHGNRPDFPFVYADEIWTGIEYQVAASLIYAGYVDEGLEVTRSVRERYRGFNRNPWAEIESGRFYARAMSSWGLLTALSGFSYDGLTDVIGFRPQINQDDFRTFWSCGTGWGAFLIDGNTLKLKVSGGFLQLEEIHVSGEYPFKSIAAFDPYPAAVVREDERVAIIFDQGIELTEGQVLSISFNH